MTNDKVFGMLFSRVYPLLINKAVRKGRNEDEVYEVTSWLTGYSKEQILSLLETDTTYGDFFTNAPCFNPLSSMITGSVCGIKVETIEDPLMQKLRYLDKLVDELAKGKPMDKILRNK